MKSTDEMDREMARVHQSLAEQEAALQHMFAMIQSMQRGDDQQRTTDERTPMRDEVWMCENCSARLGLYNRERDEMRVRYKDFLVYIKPGVGGVLRVPCRRCGEENVLSDTRNGSSGS